MKLLQMALVSLCLVLTLFWVITCGCNPLSRFEMSAECKEFYNLSPQQRETEFQTFPIETQIDLYICGMKREPPDMWLAFKIAEGGEKTIPYLIEKLKTTKKDYELDNIIMVFEIMSEGGRLRGRQDVVEQIKQAISAMKNGTRKTLSQERLDKIEKNGL